MHPRLPLPRRAALGAGLLLPGLPAAAQQGPARPPGAPAIAVVLPPPLPCADRPGDIVGLTVEGPSTGGVLVIGQAFAAGHLPRGAGLGARLAGGGAIRAQHDAKTFHPDGSVCHALVSLELPALGRGERRGVVLTRAAAVAAAPLDLAAALEGRRAVVELAPLDGGTPFAADLLALWRATPGDGWQSGPLAVQGRVGLRVPRTVTGGVDSLRLLADLAVRADGTLWVELWLRNDIAMQANGGPAAYRMRLLLDGREVRAAEVPRHVQYIGWGRLHGAARGREAPPELPFPRHDIAYLGAMGALMRYDLSTGVSERLIADWARVVAAPEWDAPFWPRGLRTRMGDGGARPDLGVNTQWQAAWMLSGDRRSATLAIGQAEAAGNIPWYFWDVGGGADRRGGWLDVRRWPGLWTDPRGGRPPRSLPQHPPGIQDSGWGPNTSHQPSVSFVPYLLTGRRAFLDNLTAQAAFNIVGIWPAVRSLAWAGWQTSAPRPSVAPAEDVLVVFQEPRGGAWAMRTIGDAVWIAPESDPNRAYLADVERRNWTWLRGVLPVWTAFQGEAHGWYPRPGQSDHTHFTPFQTEYWAAVAGVQASRGHADARAMLEWMRNFVVGRFFQDARGFRRVDGIAFGIASASPEPRPGGGNEREPYLTWARIGQAMGTQERSNQDRWVASEGEYGRLALVSLAVTFNVLGDRRALEAYEWLVNSGAPYVTADFVAGTPQQNVSPVGRPRVPAWAPACAG